MVTLSFSGPRRAATVAVIALLLACTSAWAQGFEARVDRHAITTQEVVRLIVETEGDARSILPPESDDFRVVSRSTQTNMSFINGHMTRQLTATFQLAPLRAGKLETGSATIVLNTGRRLQTPSYSVDVSDAGLPSGAQPQLPAPSMRSGAPPGAGGAQMPSIPAPYARPPAPAPTSPAARAFGYFPPMPPPGSDALITSEEATVDGQLPFLLPYVSKTSTVSGEPFLVEYLYYAPLLGLGFEASDLSEPAFKDAWFHDITESRAQSGARLGNVRINGHLYGVHLVRSYLVVPLQSGTFDVAPLGLVVEGRSLTRRTGTLALTSPALTVDVAPLPADKPDAAARSVGRYDFELRVSPLEAQVGDTIQVVMDIQGVGVPSQIHMPEFPAPKTLRPFSPSDKSTSDYHTSGWIESSLRRTLSFQATEEGDVTIPSVTFHWFDPWDATWKSHTTDPQIVRVQGVNPNVEIEAAKEDDSQLTRPSWQSALPKPEDRSPDMGWSARLRRQNEPWTGTPWFFVLFAFPLVLSLTWIASDHWRHHRRRTARTRAEHSAGRDALRAIRGLRFQRQEDFSHLSRTARAYLSALGDSSAQGATLEELRRIVARTRPDASVAPLITAVEDAESARFGGGDAATFERLRGAIEAWILEDQENAP